MESLLEGAEGKQERFCVLLRGIVLEHIAIHGGRLEPLEAIVDVCRSCSPSSLAIICHASFNGYRQYLMDHQFPLSLKLIAPWVEDIAGEQKDRLFDYLSFWTDLGGWLLEQIEEMDRVEAEDSGENDE